MKPLLTPSLLAIVLAGFSTSLASADYDGGQISNGNAAHTGSISITYNGPDEDPVMTDGHYNRTGAVELLGDEGSGKSITLEGDIRISSGADYVDVDAPRLNEGVFINPYASGSSINLKTAGAQDRIMIDVYGKGSNGVFIEGGTNNKITLDASSSDYDIEIHSRNTTTETVGGCHMISLVGEGNEIEVFGNVNSSSLAKNTRGLEAIKGSQLSLHGNFTFTSEESGSMGMRILTGAVAVVDGHLDVRTKGSGAYIVYAGDQASVTVRNGVTATSSGANSYGLYATSDAQITVGGDVDFSSSGTSANGVRASNGGAWWRRARL